MEGERERDTGVCVKKTRLAIRRRSLKNTESGAGEQFLLLDCRIRVSVKGLFFSQTPVLSIYRLISLYIFTVRAVCSST